MHSPPGTDTPGPLLCGRCGGVLPEDGVPGLCPRCEISLAMEGPEASSETVPGGLGGYEMISEAGRGGMGHVWKARQPGLGRLVAIKFLPGGEWAGSAARLRFQREAEAAARLRHPHLVAVHDCGEHEGTLWYSMDFIEGESLAERIHRAPLEAREAAVLMEKVTRAVAFAHSRNVWHRDLKPANILVDAAGEPHVTDFGLASTDASTGLTFSGHLAGSPHYLPPERVDPRNGKLPAGTATEAAAPPALHSDHVPEASGDIYALGATLYHALTGRPPFSGANVSAILAKVIADPPARPSSLKPDIPRDLETICLKCLEKSPAGRYASATELADDLKRFLDGAPVLARPISAPARLWRWAKRRPALAGLAAALTLALVSLFALMAWSAQRSRTEAARLKVTAEAAQNAEHAAQIEGALAGARSARLSERFSRREEGLNSLRSAAVLAAAGPRDEGTLRALRDEAAALIALPRMDFDTPAPLPKTAHDSYFWIERTRRWMAVYGPAPQGWRLVNDSGSRSIALPVPEPQFATTCPPDGRVAYTWSSHDLNDEGTLWDTTGESATVLRRLKGRILDWSPDSTRAVRAELNHYIVGEVPGGREICRFICGQRDPCARFSDDGKWIAAYCWDPQRGRSGMFYLAVFDARTGEELWQTELLFGIASIAWDPAGLFIATIDITGQIRIFTFGSSVIARQMPDPGGGLEHYITKVQSLDFTADGFLVSTGARSTVTVWDPASGRIMGTQSAGRWDAGGLRGGWEAGPFLRGRAAPAWLTIRRSVWTPVSVPESGESPLRDLKWSPDASHIAVSSHNGTWLWDEKARRLGHRVQAPVAGHYCMNAAFAGDGRSLVSAYIHKGLWRQSIPDASGESIAMPLLPVEMQLALVVSDPASSLMAAGIEFADRRSRIIVFDPDNSTVARRLDLPAPLSALALSPGGKLLAVGVSDPQRSLAVFRTADLSVHRDWTACGAGPHAVQFNADGSRFAAAFRHVHLYDTVSGSEIGILSAGEESDSILGAPTAAFDPAGQWLAVTEPPRRIILHRRVPESAAAPLGWQSVLTLESPSGAGITRLSFSPDGKQLAAATTRPAFELWDLAALEAELRQMGIW